LLILPVTNTKYHLAPLKQWKANSYSFISVSYKRLRNEELYITCMLHQILLVIKLRMMGGTCRGE